MRERLYYWLPVAVWAAIIFGFSTPSFSGEETGHIIVPALHWLLPSEPMDTLELIHLFIRKSAHFLNYLILGALLFRALRAENKGWAPRWALFAILLAFAYAASDEYHQSFVAGRTASATDALLDTAGAGAAQVVLWTFLRLRAETQPDQQAAD